ncbi:HAMP domain-containing histidine kinase [Candidatus Dojkabacteria bacterium]|uniref:histidine kinase n=1 Tax=Candidatus Dojkabacteria bacterium TaxID=2099670 RepID=A0A955L572_9BACT|nr:HAMP domain-containing histidine kinase [Candidatus Dojkabacteria bacterium]
MSEAPRNPQILIPRDDLQSTQDLYFAVGIESDDDQTGIQFAHTLFRDAMHYIVVEQQVGTTYEAAYNFAMAQADALYRSGYRHEEILNAVSRAVLEHSWTEQQEPMDFNLVSETQSAFIHAGAEYSRLLSQAFLDEINEIAADMASVHGTQEALGLVANRLGTLIGADAVSISFVHHDEQLGYVLEKRVTTTGQTDEGTFWEQGFIALNEKPGSYASQLLRNGYRPIFDADKRIQGQEISARYSSRAAYAHPLLRKVGPGEEDYEMYGLVVCGFHQENPPVSELEFEQVDTAMQIFSAVIDQQIKAEFIRGLAERSAGVFHDIKAPLAIMQMYTGILQKAIDQMDDPKLQRAVSTVQGQYAVLREFINTQLKAILSGQEPIQMAQFTEVNELVWDMITALQENVDGANQLIVDTVGLGELCDVPIDQTLATRIAYNLISNAFKYTGPNNDDEADVVVSSMVRGGEWVFTVADRGAGISEEDLRRIFDIGQRLGAEQTEIEGHGVGLGNIKAVVEENGGSLEYRSAVGFGTTFTVRFPIE